MPKVLNVLASRYACPAMCTLWSEENKVIAERELWIALMKSERRLGVKNITTQAIRNYEKVVRDVSLISIRERELITRHDVKARIEEFNALAGHELIHLALTSRDITENTEQALTMKSLKVVRSKMITVLIKLKGLAIEYQDIVMPGRSHNVPAQTTTLGKRFANMAQEHLLAIEFIDRVIKTMPLRGIKGPMGTQQDILDLFDGDAAKVLRLEEDMASHLGFKKILTSTGQVYPRSIDSTVISALNNCMSAASSAAICIRLMAGTEAVTEGFKEGQVGSSAMPHKMNARSSERVNGFASIMQGFVTMINSVSGNQWNEGDVSCSVLRRFVLPNAFFAIDGMLETWLTVLDEFGAYPEVIDAELQRYLPFLAGTMILMSLVKSGMGREKAHDLIKKHAVAVAQDMRTKGQKENDLLRRLADDPEVQVSLADLQEAIADPISMTGTASDQIDQIATQAMAWSNIYPEAATYSPGAIL